MISGAYVLITNRCNFNCSYCYERLEGIEDKDMPWETMQRLIDMMVAQYDPTKHANPYADMDINFFGGEPFFNWPVMKRAFEYVEEIRIKKGIRFSLTILTNGSVWNKEIHEYLSKQKVKMGNRLKLQVSIDGCEESHNANRPLADGGDSFQIVAGNIKKYRNIIQDIQIRETLVPSRVNKFYDDYVALSELADIVQMTPIIEGDWLSVLPQAKEQLEKIYALYFEQLKSSPDKFLSLLNGTIIKTNSPGACGIGHDFKGCHAGQQLIGVTVEGDIYPCHRFIAYRKSFDYKMGDVWQGINQNLEEVKAARKMHYSNAKCQSCKLGTCNRCYATNRYIEGKVTSTPLTGYCEFCALNQKLVDALSDRLFAEYDNTLAPYTAYKSRLTKRRGITMGKGKKKILGPDAEDVLVQGITLLLKTNMEIKSQNTKIIQLLSKIAGVQAPKEPAKDAHSSSQPS